MLEKFQSHHTEVFPLFLKTLTANHLAMKLSNFI